MFTIKIAAVVAFASGVFAFELSRRKRDIPHVFVHMATWSIFVLAGLAEAIGAAVTVGDVLGLGRLPRLVSEVSVIVGYGGMLGCLLVAPFTCRHPSEKAGVSVATEFAMSLASITTKVITRYLAALALIVVVSWFAYVLAAPMIVDSGLE